jgi:hypothetical protein
VRVRARLAGTALVAVVLAGLVLPAGALAGNSRSLPAHVAPPLARASKDRERPWNEGCVAFETRKQPRSCVYGRRNADYTIALIGDSHLSHFFPAFQAAALEHGWRLIVYFKTNCPFVDMRVRSHVLGREYTECATWNRRVVERVNAARPDLVVVAMYRIRAVRRVDRTNSRKAAALARMIGRLNSPVVLLADSPSSRVDVPRCLARNRHNISRCATPRRRALAGHAVVERAAARIADVPVIDLANRVCVADPCPAVVGGRIVFRDFHHLTATFTSTLGPDVARLVISVAPAAGP